MPPMHPGIVRRTLREPTSPVDTLGFVGDFCPASSPGADSPVEASPALTALLQNCDLLTVNLECPLTHRPHRKPSGVPLRADPGGVEVLTRLGVGLANLANNHMSDCGPEGLMETLDLLDDRGIAHVGAGEDLTRAADAHRYRGRSGRVAFLGLSFSDVAAPAMASSGSPGACPLDLEGARRRIRDLREEGSRVVVSFHGGWEFYRVPSPPHRALMRALSDAGAFLVLGHHGHVVLGREIRDPGMIWYGLGDFFLPVERNRRVHATRFGLGLTVEVDREGPVATSTFFVHPDYDTGRVHLVGGSTADGLHRRLEDLSRILADPRQHRRAWQAECARGVLGLKEAGGATLGGYLRKAGASARYLSWFLGRRRRGDAPLAPDDPVPSLAGLGWGALMGLPGVLRERWGGDPDPDRSAPDPGDLL